MTPHGRAAEAWARASIRSLALTRHAAALRTSANHEPHDVARHHLEVAAAIEAALEVIRLGCPIPGGWDPMVDSEEVLRAV